MSIREINIRTHQGGFSLPVAIFVIVVLALLGTMMVTIGGVQRATAAAAAQGARAYHAARAGVEWGIYRTIVGGTACTAAGGILGNFSLAVTGLNGFNVMVSCAQTSHSEHGATVRVVAITSVATYGAFGDADYVSRTLHATVTDAVAP